MNIISVGILTALHIHHQICGTKDLASLINAKPEHVQRNAITLAALGLIKIVPGSRGRGHKTVYQDAGALKQIDQEQV